VWQYTDKVPERQPLDEIAIADAIPLALRAFASDPAYFDAVLTALEDPRRQNYLNESS